MPVTMTQHDDGRTLAVDVRGTLRKEDYELFVPSMERLVDRHGKINIVVKLEEFEGVEAGALWEDLKFDMRHFNDVARVAVIGDKGWMKWMTAFSKPFTGGEVRFFEPRQYSEALDWASAGFTDTSRESVERGRAGR